MLSTNLTFKLQRLTKLQSENREKMSKKDFLNLHHGVAVVDLSVTHIRYMMFCFFRERISDESIIACPNARKHLEHLCMMFGLYHL